MHNHHTKHTPELIRAALAHIPANLPRDEWARVAMSIKSEYPDDTGRGLFEGWSAGADGYDKQACASTWRSIKAGGGVTVATLLHMAKQNGFELPKPDQTAPRPSPAEQAAQRARAQEAAAAEAARRAAEHEGAAAEAQAYWEGNCTDVTDPGQAPYLARKGVLPFGVRFDRSSKELVIPLRDGEGKLWNVQRIAPTKPERGTDKLFIRGAKKSGLCHLIGQVQAPGALLVAEGYATSSQPAPSDRPARGCGF